MNNWFREEPEIWIYTPLINVLAPALISALKMSGKVEYANVIQTSRFSACSHDLTWWYYIKWSSSFVQPTTSLSFTNVSKHSESFRKGFVKTAPITLLLAPTTKNFGRNKTFITDIFMTVSEFCVEVRLKRFQTRRLLVKAGELTTDWLRKHQ